MGRADAENDLDSDLDLSRDDGFRWGKIIAANQTRRWIQSERLSDAGIHVLASGIKRRLSDDLPSKLPRSKWKMEHLRVTAPGQPRGADREPEKKNKK